MPKPTGKRSVMRVLTHKQMSPGEVTVRGGFGDEYKLVRSGMSRAFYAEGIVCAKVLW